MPSFPRNSPGASFLLGLGLLALAAVSDEEAPEQPNPTQPAARGRPPHIGKRVQTGRPIRLYRVVTAAHPAESDFLTPANLREPAYGKELEAPELMHAVSMWSSAGEARDAALNFPRRGRWIAELTARPDDQRDVAVHPTPTERGHYDVWATPRRLLQMVSDIFPVRR